MNGGGPPAKAFSRIKEARVFAGSPPAISGMGSSAGFDMELQDHAGAGHDALMAARDQPIQLASPDPSLTRVRPNRLEGTIPPLLLRTYQRLMSSGSMRNFAADCT